MGFGLNVAPSIMRAIVEATLSKDDAVRQATSAYIDDVFINEDIASATRVRQHLANFGLVSKEPEWLQNGAEHVQISVSQNRYKSNLSIVRTHFVALQQNCANKCIDVASERTKQRDRTGGKQLKGFK